MFFVLGVIVGMLVRDIKVEMLKKVSEVKKAIENKGETQFIEPIDPKEVFKNAKTVDDLIENFNKK